MKTLLPHYDVLSDESKMRVTARIVEQILRYHGVLSPYLEKIIFCRLEGHPEVLPVTRDRAVIDIMTKLKDAALLRRLLHHWISAYSIPLLDAESFFTESVEYLGRVIGAGHMSRSEAKAVVKKSIENLLIEERSK